MIGQSAIRARLEEYRRKELQASLKAEQEEHEVQLVGREEVSLRKFREVKVARAEVEREHLESRVASLTEELEKERRARRSAEKRIEQLTEKLNDLQGHKSQYVTARVDAAFALEKEQTRREAIAKKKRELEERFSRLLQAYQELVEGYHDLKDKYTALKAEREKTTMDKVKSSLRKFKELFTQEEGSDPDRLPVFSIQTQGEQHVTAEKATCDFCGTDGICRGFHPSPIKPSFCTCGHEKTAHCFAS